MSNNDPLIFDPDYWNQRYQNEDTPWDIGELSLPLRFIMDEVAGPEMKILIPGAGRAYEAVYLHQKGFPNVYVCDWAPSAFEHLRRAAPDFPEEHLITGDFFQLEEEFDLMLEQAFFCALPPDMRPLYARKTAGLLRPNGLLAGVLFGVVFPFEGPPFGGSLPEYEGLFQPYFDREKMEICQSSIPPRAGSEIEIRLRKK